MKNNNFIYEQCLKTLNSQEFKKEVKNILQPLLDYIGCFHITLVDLYYLD